MPLTWLIGRLVDVFWQARREAWSLSRQQLVILSLQVLQRVLSVMSQKRGSECDTNEWSECVPKRSTCRNSEPQTHSSWTCQAIVASKGFAEDRASARVAATAILHLPLELSLPILFVHMCGRLYQIWPYGTSVLSPWVSSLAKTIAEASKLLMELSEDGQLPGAPLFPALGDNSLD